MTVVQELDILLNRAKADGLVHCAGPTLVGDQDGDVSFLLQVLANLLRIRETHPTPAFSTEHE